MQIIIQHITGSKANQVEQFDSDKVNEITFGRDPTCTVTFDPQQDDQVSRRHAVLKVARNNTVSFRLADLGSTNGTKVNGRRIAEETELDPESRVQLGNGGPEFVFDLSPRPPERLQATRVFTPPTRAISATAGAASTTFAVPPTGVHPVPPTAAAGGGGGKQGIGRETVMGMLRAERQTVSRQWMYITAGILAVVALGGGALYWRMNREHEKNSAAIAAAEHEAATQIEQQRQASDAARNEAEQIKEKMGMTPEEIVRNYGHSTAEIKVHWRLYDKSSGKPVYQKAWLHGSKLYPVFVRMDDDTLVRWLTLDADNGTNLEMGVEGQASGFLVTADGFLLTNKHVAAAWLNRYGDADDMIYVVAEHAKKISSRPAAEPIRFGAQPGSKDLWEWLPASGATVFDNNRPEPIYTKGSFEGRDDVLEVRFPLSRFAINARLVRASTDSDVALIKIDAPQSLTPLQLAGDARAPVGSSITVLGYPESSAKLVQLKASNEGGVDSLNVGYVPEPTVIPGSIARLSERLSTAGTNAYRGTFGDAYQLNAAADSGCSGGPVFDEHGHVIGLLTYRIKNRETMTLAVPIQYGRRLETVENPFDEGQPVQEVQNSTAKGKALDQVDKPDQVDK